jgi:hypothetical protein
MSHSFRAAINAKCRECIYDPLSRGTWREQVADCINVNCGLHALRPVPRHATVRGKHCPEKVSAIRAKLAQTVVE